ncbi:hypothetical protein BJY04DRAFT_215430 [Aspergillus karnatakaensis]|uniref:uncharacterized protein n=1 Tax=Aspergillus karnatakaensis TaxID=1810916 RepID=UPI003CCD5CED
MQCHTLNLASEDIERVDLAYLVGDVSEALSELLKRSSLIYRGLSRSLAILVVELQIVDFGQQSATSRKLQRLLRPVAECLDSAINSDYVQEIYHQLMKRNTEYGSRLWLFESGDTCGWHNINPDRWKKFPLPTLGMLHEVLGSQSRNRLQLARLLTDDQSTIKRLKKQIKDWNELVDLAYDGGDDEYKATEAEDEVLSSFMKDSAFCGEDSVRQLSCTLHDVLHSNWPCHVEDHHEDGMLGHCSSAKLCLDSGWTCRGVDPVGGRFFILLTGGKIIQECRVCVSESRMADNGQTVLCQVYNEDSRPVCLHLTRDENNRLWPQLLAHPPETVKPDQEYDEHSLGKLLQIVKPSYASKRVLGVIIARSFLHLLGGPWIPWSFCIDDISMFCRVEDHQMYPLFDKFNVHPFPAILALGITLTEIELGDDLTNLYKDPMVAKLKNRPFGLAKCLLQECQRRFHESGLLRAVRFCIERESFLQFANTSIDALFSKRDFVDTFYLSAVVGKGKIDEEGICKVITKLQVDEVSSTGPHTPLLSTSLHRPVSRDNFEVAIICALPLEANAVLSLFDQFFDNGLSLAQRN